MTRNRTSPPGLGSRKDVTIVRSIETRGPQLERVGLERRREAAAAAQRRGASSGPTAASRAA